MEKKEKPEISGQKKKKKIPWGMIYVAATIVAVILFGVFNREFGNVFKTISNLTPGFLTIAILVTLVFFIFEGEIIRLLMRSQNIKMKMHSGMKIGLLGIYYSYITPSSTGGQPMQAAYLRRDNIPVGVSTAVLIMKFFAYQCAFELCSVVSFVVMYGKLQAENPVIIPFIILGLIVNGFSILFFPSLFFKPVLHALCRAAKWIVRKIKFLETRFHLLESVDKFETDFGSYTDDFRGKIKSILLSILLSIPQFILQMSVIYFIFRSFGYRDVNYFEILAIQSMLQASVSFMPMPGASGAQEIGFSSYFHNYFVNNDLYAAVMVWRFFTYYLVVIAGALLVVADQFWYRKKQQKNAAVREGTIDDGNGAGNSDEALSAGGRID